MKALIDGDIVLYSVGFASEERYYECSDGHLAENAKEAKEHCAIVGEFTEEPLTYTLCREPVEDKIWKGNANSMVKGILDATEADDYVIYITGKGNFRTDIYPEYKANRKNVDKPLHYQDLKDWLIKTRPCEVVDGEEADDAMGIAQAQAEPFTTAICSLDKDMDMIAGRHYNWRKHLKYTVTQEDGDRWFWTQLLTGDATDNIIGLKGIGPKKAEKALAEYVTNQDMYAVCCAHYSVMDRLDDLELNGHLLWIKRNDNSTWKELING